jgi:glycosyltransferase involved in cell wall biosynthesis
VSDIKLVIAGPDDGSLSQIQQQIRELQIENDVLYTGPLYGKDKLEAYIDADVFVLPSRYEAFPNTILEAWACGTPVIATKNCCISDVIRDTEESAVIDCDPVQMKEKILDLLSNEEKRKKIGMKGKKLVQDNFEITKLVQKIEGIYETI